MSWSCEDDCKYKCMHAVEAKRSSIDGTKVFKYYGKWPFQRVWGMQEVCSVAFSFLNLLMHLLGLMGLMGHWLDEEMFALNKRNGTRLMTALWITYSITHCFAWTASCLFHARDTRTTERIDYFLADAVVALGFICAVSRLIIDPHLQISKQAAFHLRNLTILLTSIAIAHHTHYMLTVKFDYGLNMTKCIILGAMTSGVWGVWLLVIRKQDHPSAALLLRFLLLAYAALLFEVLDFPPLFQLIDAHSLWHFFTVPLTFLFYRFVICDLKHIHEFEEEDDNHMKKD